MSIRILFKILFIQIVHSIKTKQYFILNENINTTDLDMIYVNDDYQYLDAFNNSSRFLLAVRQKFELVILYQDADDYKEHSLYMFNSRIKSVQPYWYFNQIFVLTFNKDTSIAYQINLELRIISEIYSLKTKKDVLMIADPFRG